MDSYHNMVVVFIDILGTKNNKEFEDKYRIHRLFHEEAKANEERNLPHVIYTRRVRSFSDCAYFIYDYKDNIEDCRKDEMKLLRTAMNNTSLSILRILNAGHVVRGGIALGETFYDEIGFFGPAVEKAHTLESKYADVPMIALDKELGKRYFEWENARNNGQSEAKLVKHKGGKYYLNVFYPIEGCEGPLFIKEDCITFEGLKETLLKTIERDQKLNPDSSPDTDDYNKNKSNIYKKLEWLKEEILSRPQSKYELENGARSIPIEVALIGMGVDTQSVIDFKKPSVLGVS